MFVTILPQMLAMRFLDYFSSASLLTVSNAAATIGQFCKRDPTSSQWPSVQQWDALNVSVSGALLIPTAPAAVCHPDQPAYNNATCATLMKKWNNTDWVAHNPQLTNYNDDTCLPNALALCSTAGYPAYIINAQSADDVVAGVKFAKDNQIRLVVKGTGHDWPGRSSGPGSLSIWTHNLQGINTIRNDSRAVQYGGVASMKISAGMRMRDVYTEAAKHNLTVVGGADPGVGIGGWISGGGHGPLTAKYGMGADQALEMEVVTADGQVLTVNETTHEDLFWALRGGGASTYAVLLSVTVRAYASIPVTRYAYSYNTTAYSDTFWSAVAHFHADLPRISNAGGMGYYYILPGGGQDTGGQGVIVGIWLFPERTEEDARKTTEPFEQMLNSSPLWATDRIHVSSSIISVPDFTSFWLSTNPAEGGGVDGRLVSWLLDGPSLTSNLTNMALQLRSVSPAPWDLLGNLVAAPGTRNVTIPGGSSAILPAWREAYTHLIAPQSWTPLNITLKNSVTQSLRNEVMPVLRSLAPNSGGYINENDPTNPNWKHDYFGSNYDRLLAIKNKWDPEGVFWCKPCVGHDQWEVINGPSSEDKENWGVSQVGGSICRLQGERLVVKS